MRSRVGEVRGDPRRVDHKAAQLPPVVGERAYDGAQLGGVRVASAGGAVDRHLGRHELGEVLEGVRVAARVVAAIERRDFVVGHAMGLSFSISQSEARRGAEPLIGSDGVWRRTRLRLALSGPYGG